MPYSQLTVVGYGKDTVKWKFSHGQARTGEICQVTEVELTPAVSPETVTVVDIIKKLLPTPAPPPLQAVPIRLDRDLVIQQLM